MTELLLRYWIPELSDIYDEKGARIWLTAPHPLLGGKRAIDLIAAGEVDKVEVLLDQLRSGAVI